MKKKYKILFTTLVTAIILISIFAAMIQTGMIKLDITSTKIDEGRPLFLKIFVDENTGTMPFGVNFSSLILYHEGAVSYKWDFGDGNTSDEINPTYVYQENGTYNCSLTVTDSIGKKKTDIIEIIVNANQGPVPTIIFSDRAPSRPYVPLLSRRGISKDFEGQTLRRWMERSFFPTNAINKLKKSFLSVEGTAYDPEGDKIVSYEWELRPPAFITQLGNQVKPLYTYTGEKVDIPFLDIYTTSNYDLTLIVTDDKGNKGYTTTRFLVYESTIESFRNTLESLWKDRIIGHWWLQIFKDTALEPVTNLLVKFLGILPLPMLKIVIGLWVLLTLSVPLELKDYIKEFLQKHKAIGNITDRILTGIQKILKNMKDKHPDQAEFFNKLIDWIELRREKYGFANERPIIKDPFPNNGDRNIPKDCPYVSINVTDPEGDRFNVTISGDYVNDKYYDNVTTGVFNATLITPLPPVTDIIWHVMVVDQNGKEVQGEFKFTTFSI